MREDRVLIAETRGTFSFLPPIPRRILGGIEGGSLSFTEP